MTPKKCQGCQYYDGTGCGMWEEPVSCGELRYAAPVREFQIKDALYLFLFIVAFGGGLILAGYILRLGARGLGFW